MFYVAGDYAPLDEVRPSTHGDFLQPEDSLLPVSYEEEDDADIPVDQDFASSRFLVKVLASSSSCFLLLR